MSTPYIAMYPTDFLADVGHLGNTELGIYWRLLLVYYRDGRPLPFDVDRLRRLAMAFSPEECRSMEAIISEFFVLSTEPDGSRVWRNRRADIEIAKAANAREKKSLAAKATNERRWGRGDDPHPAGAVAKRSLERVAEQSLERVAERLHSDSEPEPEPEPEKLPSLAEKVVVDAPRRRSKPTADAVAMMVAEGVNPKVAADWMRVRKEKRLPLTALAWQEVKDQAAAAGLTPATAVEYAARKTWGSFKASWWLREEGKAPVSAPKSPFSRCTDGQNYSEGIDEHGNLL